MSQIKQPISSCCPDPRRSFRPGRGRVALAAIVGPSLLAGVYFALPPVFKTVAGTEPAAQAVVAEKPAGPFEFQSLPSIPMNPSIAAHRQSIEMLEKGVRRLREIPAYTANFSKEEIVWGRETGPQTMRLKLRHEPFSVYLRWIEGKQGQELLYVTGRNEGKMLVRAAGFKGLLGAIKLEVDGDMAMRESRHPVTEMGLLELAKTVLSYRYHEASWKSGYQCSHDKKSVDGRPCHHYTLVYEDQKRSPEYRKSEVWIDAETFVIAKIRNFGWPEEKIAKNQLDEATLLEEYTYTNINFHPQLMARDFSATNDNYRLRR